MTFSTNILINEQQLFAQTAEGDETAFRKIFEHYAKRVYPFILGKTKSEHLTQELTQEIFIQLWQHRVNLMEVENHAGYIFTMAARQVYQHFRKAARDQQLAKEWAARIEELRNTTEEWMDGRQHEQLIDKAVQQLPPQRRRIYELSRVQGMNHAEIAKELNLSPSTVNNQLTEALKFIRKHIGHSPEASIGIVVYLLEKA